jgi:hypothetical protein
MTTSPLPACLIDARPSVDSGIEWQQQHATWVYRGLLDGTVLDHGPDQTPVPHAVTRHEIGRLPLPGGRIDTGDLYLAGGSGYDQPLPIGDHLCVLAEGTIEPGHQRAMAAVLITGTEPIVRWSEGLDGTSDDDLEVGDYHGFPIDSGVAAFFAPVGADEMIGEIDDDVYDRFEANGFNGAMMRTTTGQPVATFASGWGDGRYPTWFGLAADGSVSVVMADFFVFTDPFPEDDDPADAPALESVPAP